MVIQPGSNVRMARTVRVQVGERNFLTLTRGLAFKVHAVDAGLVRLYVGADPTRIVYVKRTEVEAL